MYFYARTGYALARARNGVNQWFGSVKGQSLFGAGVGYQWPVGKNKITMSIGGKRQNLKTISQNGSFESITDWTLRRLEFKVGVTF